MPTPQSFNSGLSPSACSRGVSRPFSPVGPLISGNAVGRPASGSAAACRALVPLCDSSCGLVTAIGCIRIWHALACQSTRCPLLISPLACTQWSSGRFLRDGSSPVQHKASRPGTGMPFRPTPTGYLGKSKHGTPGPWLTCNNSLPVRRHPLHGLATITRLVDHAPWTRCAVSCPSHERSLYALRN